MAERISPSTLQELECLQISILRRIENLESRLLSDPLANISTSLSSSIDGGLDSTENRLSAILRELGARDFEFRRVPEDYYNRTLEYRMECLGAHSIEHLCKSIVMVCP